MSLLCIAMEHTLLTLREDIMLPTEKVTDLQLCLLDGKRLQLSLPRRLDSLRQMAVRMILFCKHLQRLAERLQMQHDSASTILKVDRPW